MLPLPTMRVGRGAGGAHTGPINPNKCPCSPPHLPGCPGAGKTKVPDTEKAVTEAGPQPGGHIYTNMSLAICHYDLLFFPPFLLN